MCSSLTFYALDYCCVCAENESRIPLDAEVRLIYGIIGVIRLLAGNSCSLSLLTAFDAYTLSQCVRSDCIVNEKVCCLLLDAIKQVATIQLNNMLWIVT